MSGERPFLFDGYDFQINYAEHLIQDLEDHFEKYTKNKCIVSSVTQCSSDVAHCPVTEREAYYIFNSLGSILLIFVVT